jgi:hypothetical protein
MCSWPAASVQSNGQALAGRRCAFVWTAKAGSILSEGRQAEVLVFDLAP